MPLCSKMPVLEIGTNSFSTDTVFRLLCFSQSEHYLVHVIPSPSAWNLPPSVFPHLSLSSQSYTVGAKDENLTHNWLNCLNCLPKSQVADIHKGRQWVELFQYAWDSSNAYSLPIYYHCITNTSIEDMRGKKKHGIWLHSWRWGHHWYNFSQRRQFQPYFEFPGVGTARHCSNVTYLSEFIVLLLQASYWHLDRLLPQLMNKRWHKHFMHKSPHPPPPHGVMVNHITWGRWHNRN